MARKLVLFTALIVMMICVVQSCEYNDTTAASDKSLYADAVAGGYVYFDGGNLLDPVAPSPHGTFKLRFNPIAAAALDANGKLPAGNTFPSGSVLVKEVFTNGKLGLYAVMKKDPTNANAGEGYVWAELYLNGTAAYSSMQKGVGCISCHATAPSRDLTRTFDLH